MCNCLLHTLSLTSVLHYCILSTLLIQVSTSSSFAVYTSAHTHGPCRAPPPRCPSGDNLCSMDLAAFDALREIYFHLDDNKDGKVDKAESQEFVRDELRYEDDATWSVRQSSLHGEDNLMTVEEFWCDWVDSVAHNWTQSDLLDWLSEEVDLPQYRDAFERAALDGRVLPLLGAGAIVTNARSSRFLVDTLGVRMALHRQKVALKAIDLVVFGTSKKLTHGLKDLALLVAFVLILVCTCLVFNQRRYASRREARMQRELDALQSAEEALASMRKRLSEAEEFKQTVLQEKNLLELKLKLQDRKSKELEAAHRARKESLEQYGANSREVINQLHDEILQLSNSLKHAEIQLEAAQISSSELQFWLQLTYEFELEHFNAKKRLAESQFQQVKESCEKIRKRRNAFLGSMRIAHGDILTTVDERIAEARKTLEDVIADASERTVRWSYIQRACGLEIVVNPGLQALQAQERNRLANTNSNTGATASMPLSTASATNNGNSLSESSSMYGLRSMQSSSGISASFSTSPSNGNLAGACGLSTLARRPAPVDENYSGLWMSSGLAGRASGRHEEDDAAVAQRRLLDCTLSTNGEMNTNASPGGDMVETNALATSVSTPASSLSATPLVDVTGSPPRFTMLRHNKSVSSFVSARCHLDANSSHATLTHPQAHLVVPIMHVSANASVCNDDGDEDSSPPSQNPRLRRRLGAFHASFRVPPQYGVARSSLAAWKPVNVTHPRMATLDSELQLVTNGPGPGPTASAANPGNDSRSRSRVSRTSSFSHDIETDRTRIGAHHWNFHLNSFNVAGPAKMRNELDSLILDAAGAFAKPVMQHGILAARASHEIPTVTDQRLAAARNSPSAAAHKVNGHFGNEVSSLHSTAALTVSDESLSASDNTVKPWVFHWRAKTRLAQLRRRSSDKFVRSVDASSQ